MKKPLLHWVAGFGIAAALSSCVDPYYATGGGSYNTGYGTGYGYGDGYGYGGSNFSTSLFVSTGNPQWAYDPYCYSYYDNYRRCYYDPYLYGYYPIGYRPQAIYGCPHPYGWRQGSGHCPPPRTVRNMTVVNYRNRESAYRNSNYQWAKQVRQAPNHYSDRNTNSGYQFQKPNDGGNPGWNQTGSRPPTGTYGRSTYQGGNNSYQGMNGSNKNHKAQLPQSYNSPVNSSSWNQKPSKQNYYQTRSNQETRTYQQRSQPEPRTYQQRSQPEPRQAPRDFQRGGNSQPREEHSKREEKQQSSGDGNSSHGDKKRMHGLGDG